MAQSVPVTDFKDLSKLYTGRKQICRLGDSPLRPVYGLDTETDTNGNLFLIADSDGRYLDRDISAESVIDFLFAKKYQGSWNFFYNLSFDATVILKLLGQQLYEYKHTRRLRFRCGDYRLAYIPGKCLQIMRGHHSAVFYDIAQYYNRVSIVKAYAQNVGKLDDEYIQFKSKRDLFSRRFYRRNTSAVRQYCTMDASLAKQLAEKWIALFHRAFGFYPARWFSSGYLAEKVLVNSGIKIPTFDSIPYKVQDMAFRSYFGGRFEILKRGFIGEAYLYDINSAYPHALTQIPDLQDGRWTSAKSILPEARLGFFEIEADIPDVRRVPPFPFRANNVVIFPSGKFRTYLTLAELLACEDDHYYRILNSWQFVPDGRCKYPYKAFIDSLYAKRLELKQKGDPMQQPIKIILNSFYGKTGQKINRVIGNIFNPVIFASITGITRAKLYKFVMDSALENDVVSFATDSICTTRRLDLKSSILGDFSLDKSGNDAYYLQNGIYRFNGVWKQRGLATSKGKTFEHIESIGKDGKLYLVLEPLKSESLRECIIQGRIQDIGKIRPKKRLVNLDADRKRLWLGRLTSLDNNQFNDSMPLSLNYFHKDVV